MILYRSRADVKTLCNFAVRLALAENSRRHSVRRPLFVDVVGQFDGEDGTIILRERERFTNELTLVFASGETAILR